MKTRYTVYAYAVDKKGVEISRAVNSYTKTHPLQKYFASKAGCKEKIYLHAEISALLKAKGRQVYGIYVYRFDKAGERVSSKPCAVCLEAIKAFGVKFLCYHDLTGSITLSLVKDLK
jgi:tRNA(Arg) A34 adenosine deaminase TadA